MYVCGSGGNTKDRRTRGSRAAALPQGGTSAKLRKLAEKILSVNEYEHQADWSDDGEILFGRRAGGATADKDKRTGTGKETADY